MCRSALMFLLSPKAITTSVENSFIMHSHYAKGSWNHQNNSTVCSCLHVDLQKMRCQKILPTARKLLRPNVKIQTPSAAPSHSSEKAGALYLDNSVLPNTFPYLSGPSHIGRCGPKGTSAMIETFFSWQTVGSLLLPSSGHMQECYIE